MKIRLILILVSVTAVLLLISLSAFRTLPAHANSEDYQLELEELATGLNHPWALAFLPDGRFLISERPGRLLVVSADGSQKTQIPGLPDIVARGQGGLLDLILHPDFQTNQRIYFSYSAGENGDIGTEVARARLEDDRLDELKVIFRMQPKSDSSRHFGSRLFFTPEGFLYISLGDRGDRPRAQRLDDHAGSLIRIDDDGGTPDDNPFTDLPFAQPQIYSYGHRNIQGLAQDPVSGYLWAHEHGPKGGDELNLIQKGANYGWPVITYGRNYGSGTKIGEGLQKEGMLQPVHYWVPSIAPSGLMIYSGDQFPHWRGQLFVGSLKDEMLVRLQIKGNKVVEEEHLLKGVIGRIRDVRQGPDGLIYLLSDHSDGKLVRIKPLDR